MTNLFISVVLVGFAVTYIIEFLDLFIFTFVSKHFLNKFFALPLSFGGIFVMDSLTIQMIVSVPSATLISLLVGKHINKPVVVRSFR